MTSCMNAWILTILATLEADSGDPDFDYYCFDDIQLFWCLIWLWRTYFRHRINVTLNLCSIIKCNFNIVFIKSIIIIAISSLKKKKEKNGVALTQLSLTLHYSIKIFYNQFYIPFIFKHYFLCSVDDELPAFVIIVLYFFNLISLFCLSVANFYQ